MYCHNGSLQLGIDEVIEVAGDASRPGWVEMLPNVRGMVLVVASKRNLGDPVP
jgi:hypothetical protein